MCLAGSFIMIPLFICKMIIISTLENGPEDLVHICKMIRMMTGLYNHFLPWSFNIGRDLRHYLV